MPGRSRTRYPQSRIAGDEEQPPHPPQGAGDEIPSGGVLPAPGAVVHPVVHAAGAVRAFPLELVLVAPRLLAPAPGAPAHGILHAAAAAPVAARVHAEAAGGLQRLLRGVPLLLDVDSAPGTVGVLVRDDPAAVVALRAGHVLGVSPLLRPAAVGAVRPVPLELAAADATVLGAGARSRRLRVAIARHRLVYQPLDELGNNPSPPCRPRWPCRVHS